MSDALHDALARGTALLGRGDLQAGLTYLLTAAEEIDADPRDYDAVVHALKRAYALLDRPRSYAHRDLVSRRSLPRSTPLRGATRGRRRAHVPTLGDDASAARLFEEAGLLPAAMARERASEFERARGLWARLAHRLGSTRDAGGDGAHGPQSPEQTAEQRYVLGLVRYNVARNSSAAKSDRHSERGDRLCGDRARRGRGSLRGPRAP